MSFKDTKLGRIPSEWDIKTLGDSLYIKARIGWKGLKKSEYLSSSNYRIINGSNIDNNKIDWNNCGYITEERYEESPEIMLDKNDIIMTKDGTIGKVAIIKDIQEKTTVASGLFVIRVLNEEININYLYYYFNSHYFKGLIKSRTEGSVIPHLYQRDLVELLIPLPSRNEQNKIAKILSDLDSKIEINNKINKNLEEIAQTIFKQWFIDFEFPCVPENYKFSGAGKPCNPEGAGKPCNPEEAGKPRDFDKVCTYKRVGGLPIPDGDSWFVYVLLCEDGSFYKGMTKDLYRRFYEHYTGIGAEWTKTHKPVKVIHYEKFNTQEEARKREEELKSGYGREWIKREYKKYQEGLPAHQTRLMMAGEMVESELGMIPKKWCLRKFGDIVDILDSKRIPLSKKQRDKMDKVYPYYGAASLMDYVEDYIFDDIYVLMGEDGTVIDSNGYPILQYVWGKFWVNNHAHVLKGKGEISEEFIYLLLKNQNVTSIVTGAVQPKINQQNMRGIKLVLPEDEKLMIQFSEIIRSIFANIRNNEEQNRYLSKLRDILLPKLMSGEIRVNID